MNLFETATRNKYRFTSPVGSLTIEQLWDLPLTDNVTRTGNTASLNSIGMHIKRLIATTESNSLIETKEDKLLIELNHKLEIVKYIIAYKQNIIKESEERAKKAEERRQLLDILAEKETQELRDASKEEILKKLEALG